MFHVQVHWNVLPAHLPGERKWVLLLATKAIVKKHVNLSLQVSDGQAHRARARDKEILISHNYEVQQYASVLLTLGLFLKKFIDAVREGDGDRICMCWSFLLLIFKATGRKNYAIEAFKLLTQLNYILYMLSPRMAAQLKWSRTINVHGKNSWFLKWNQENLSQIVHSSWHNI